MFQDFLTVAAAAIEVAIGISIVYGVFAVGTRQKPATAAPAPAQLPDEQIAPATTPLHTEPPHLSIVPDPAFVPEVPECPVATELSALGIRELRKLASAHNARLPKGHADRVSGISGASKARLLEALSLAQAG